MPPKNLKSIVSRREKNRNFLFGGRKGGRIYLNSWQFFPQAHRRSTWHTAANSHSPLLPQEGPQRGGLCDKTTRCNFRHFPARLPEIVSLCRTKLSNLNMYTNTNPHRRGNSCRELNERFVALVVCSAHSGSWLGFGVFLNDGCNCRVDFLLTVGWRSEKRGPGNNG